MKNGIVILAKVDTYDNGKVDTYGHGKVDTYGHGNARRQIGLFRGR